MTQPHHGDSLEHSPSEKYVLKAEVDTISGRRAGFWSALLAIFAFGALLLMFLFWKATIGDAIDRDIAFDTTSDRLNPHQQATRAVYERNQTEQLSSYDWVDREKEIVRIPIDRAMKLFIEQQTNDTQPE